MALLTNLWFPNGAKPWDFAAADCYGAHFTPTQQLLETTPEYAERIALVADPSGSGETVCRMVHRASDPSTPAGPKTQLAPAFTTANRDPITNWAGQSASRRWYRIKFMLPADHVWETWHGNSQRLVVFQIHDTVDTSPADYDASPSLWIIAKPDGTLWLELTSCNATQTTSDNFTVRAPYRFKVVPGVPIELVFHIKWAWDNTGSMEIWQDRRKVYFESGIANTLNHDPARGGAGNFAILSVYCSADLIDRTVYHWGIQIGDESYATYNDFAAACGAGSELELAIATGGFNIGV